MNDFYSAAAQIIPILLLAMVLESPNRLRILLAGHPVVGRRGQWLRRLLRAVLGLSVVAEVLALGGLSFDEERFPVANTAVAVFVWCDVLVLAAGIAWLCIQTLNAAWNDSSDPPTDGT